MIANEEQKVACQQAAGTSEESTRCLLAAFAFLGIPESVIDVGCGDGHLVVLAARLGCDSVGVDIAIKQRAFDLDTASAILLQRDLTAPIGLNDWPFHGERVAMVLCLEVAEHLPESAAETLCDTLTGAVAPGGTLLFSAATPGQGGAGHLNEQPHDYWRLRLAARGMRERAVLTGQLRAVWLDIAPAAWWYGKNLLVYRRPA